MKKYNNFQLIFLASIIAIDFSSGLIIKSILTPTGVLNLIRIDMILPICLMMISRLLLDRFGTLILYELAWGVLAIIAMPTSFSLPGILKIVPCLAQGICYDSIMSLLKKLPRLRLYLAAILGTVITHISIIMMKMAMGIPLSKITIGLYSSQFLTSLIINIVAVIITLSIWKRIKDIHLARKISL